MAIPSIAPYPIPDGPFPSAVDWQLDADRSALLIHDMQRYFLEAYRPDAEPIATALPNIVGIREACATAGVPVIYTAQPGDQHPSRRGILSEFWGRGLASGPDEQIVPELAPRPGDIEVTKWRYSAFQRTDLRQLLAHHGRDQLVIVGVYAHMGCMISATEAFMSDIAPFFVVDAMADFSADEHRMAAEYIGKRAGRVITSRQVIEALDSARDRPRHAAS
ncbi:putative isochorismatase [Gordonia hirsuta DSM 44140 = NBRC 16056]|uniref:Putative isochorismatase n=1 Tax=Gordonia hirsuta DSM 44140 = NBRC 16056 TaxID=1121927 RepID=L7LDB4_9ACTN|nr:isochorismatase family protein [Gordonia hirsuta]GAC58904.1 putative isochorismatase [Gordonia hirsuta DSM 44140 = NBRC 16056]